MRGESLALLILLGGAATASAAQEFATDGNLGAFEGRRDVGVPRHPGSSVFDAATATYRVSGSGANMWFNRDDFHFVYKRIEGEVSLAADIRWPGSGVNPHRKACLLIRQDLSPESAYVDAALHGDGLISLQFREVSGGPTREVQAAVRGPRRLRIERRGKYVLLFASDDAGVEQFTGAAVRIDLTGPCTVGLGVCSHDDNVVETAEFRKVQLGAPPATRHPKPVLYSTLEVQSAASTDRRVVRVAPERFEAPNWLPDGKTLIYNREGRIWRVPAGGGEPEAIDTGFATRCNNDHGISPDGKWLAISDQSQGDRKSRIYRVPIGGGTPQLVTERGPSYWHGWSPDGSTLAYCAERDGEFDVYTAPAEGGVEKRLTTARGLDDGPEYSSDGRWIYFNSDRTGRMQIWRMRPDGSAQESLTGDGFNDWFAHPSPDGRSLVFVSFEKDVQGHPENKDVLLRRMDLASRRIDVLGRFFGGQGTVNVPCWSPDGKQIAFVTYQLIP